MMNTPRFENPPYIPPSMFGDATAIEKITLATLLAIQHGRKRLAAELAAWAARESKRDRERGLC